ncbi:XRE family transcriptional regulator [Ktedonosporobacter rubrisoli]|uniref:XRE family transcriptional regulator n=1 Tax=Ktedonosporobacter rubrisoli TaxID=2509675 RepID=A0A4P6K3R3_KTERU|nr:tetratricopeptide repeat protein [Ktedonosporobacter rubrisoli]QBD82602.1 XRE family transcriptional regulator [Ktedonosporobacter rubrisoli]
MHKEYSHPQSKESSPDQLFKLFRSRPRLADSGKLKQTEIAARVQVDVRAVQQWENGERLPSAENLKKLLRVFVEEDLFIEQREREEARFLWQAVKQTYEQRPGTTRLYPPFDEEWFRAILSDRREEFLVSAQREKVKTNLPTPLTGFVGREQELAKIKSLFTSTRLITLAGTGGCGKTRLALEAARDLVEHYRDGVWFFDFATVREPAFILEMVAMTLGIVEEQGSDQAQVLTNWLRRKQILLIMDNCEQLVAGCALLIESWLRTCPYLHILVTSREILNIVGEHVLSVSPLPVPTVQTQGQLAWDTIRSSPAVRLFTERAQAVHPAFELTPENAVAIAQICQRLDGLPLALELAAARMNLLSATQLLERLAAPLSLLTGSTRTHQPHQQTLRTSLDWSYQLLETEEQELFRHVSIFAGGWTLPALEALTQAKTGLPKSERTLQILSQLVAKSLVIVQRSTPNAEPRFLLLDTIRQYSQERLAEHSNEAERSFLQEKHAAFYASMAEESESHLRSAQRAPWLRHLKEEYENIRAALSWSTSHNDMAGHGLRIAAALYWFWLHQGSWSEGSRWLTTLLELAHAHKADQEQRILAKAAHGAGILAWVQGKQEEAAGLAQESLAAARMAEDREAIAICLRLVSQILQAQGESQQALAYATESVTLARAQANSWNLATSLNNLATIIRLQGESEKACAFYEESIALLREIGDMWELSAPLRNLGSLMIQLGDYQRAHILYREALHCCQEMRGAWFLSRSFEDIAFLLNRRGEAKHAATLLGVAEGLRERLGASLIPFTTQAYEENLESLQSQLNQEACLLAWQSGKDMEIEQALAFALQVL